MAGTLESNCAAGRLCENVARMECGNCHLLKYCSKECQKAHWPEHRPDCRSDLLKESWQPGWAREGRKPAFMDSGIAPFVSFGRNKYLWGNIPAVDILQLKANEGEGYEGPLGLLFAASGDLRNVIKTVADLPTCYSGRLNIDINDQDMDIVARNIIFLLLSYTSTDDNDSDTVECVLHLWYSALLPQSCLDKLASIRRLIEEVCSRIKDKPAAAVLGKTWTFPTRKGSIRVVLTHESWDALLPYFQVPEGLSTQRAKELRADGMLNPRRVDYMDRHLYTMKKPHWRVCNEKLRKDGLLLPFGAHRDNFTVPNPTFFQTADEWPMKDSANAFEGWPIADVFAMPSTARNDVNGKLFAYIYSRLDAFHQHTKTLPVNFCLYQGLVQEAVPSMLLAEKYDRIEVSNICDRCWVGTAGTLQLFGPLLRPENPHATLLALYLNAVDETFSPMDQMLEMQYEMRPLSKYLDVNPDALVSLDTSHPDMLRFSAARVLFRNTDKYFSRYMGKEKFEQIGEALGLVMKPKNTIVEPWPYKLKRRPGQRGAQEEFDMLLGSSHSGIERYVEWKRS